MIRTIRHCRRSNSEMTRKVDSAPGRDGGAVLQTSPARVSMEDFGAGHMGGLSVDLDFEPESDGKIVPAAAAGSPLEAAVQDLSREELDRIMTDLEANVPAGPSQSRESERRRSRHGPFGTRSGKSPGTIGGCAGRCAP